MGRPLVDIAELGEHRALRERVIEEVVTVVEVIDADRGRPMAVDAPGRTRIDHEVTLEALIGVAHRIAVVERPERSEEHTPALQSLMRISYDVIRSKNKTNMQQKIHTTAPHTAQHLPPEVF